MHSIDIRDVSVLIVDKNPLLRTVFRQVLRELGASDVATASNVENGFAAFQANNPDVVLADWGPGCDGLELLDQMRNDPASVNPFVPVVITSAYTEAEAVISARDMGMSGFLAKPVSAETLYTRIARVLSESRSFVRSGAFFGPDRRYQESEATLGDRRQSNAA